MEHDRSIIEDATISSEGRLVTAPGRRYVQRKLRNMQGAFLTLLDEEERILMFVAGALRFRESATTDAVISMPMSRVLDGIIGKGNPQPGEAYQPKYMKQILSEDRANWVLKIAEIPYVTAYLGRVIDEARSWGLLTVGPDPQQPFDGVKINGQNKEIHINSRTWKVEDLTTAPPVAGSGSGDLTVRMSPKASYYAQGIPNAWLLAVVAAKLYGGISHYPPFPVSGCSEVSALIDAEKQTQMQKKAEFAARDAARRANRHQSHDMAALQSAIGGIDPASMQALETVAAQPGGN